MNKALSIFPRFLSGLIELPNALLQSPLVSGRILPWDNSINIGSIDRPFNEIYSAEVYNSHGILGVNHIDVYEPLSIEGTWNPIIDLQYDNSLQVVNGKLGIVPKILTNADIDLRSEAPIRMLYDDDLIGASIMLDYDEDDFYTNDDKKLKTKDLYLLGKGGISIGGIEGEEIIEFIDELDDAISLPKVKMIKIETDYSLSQTLNKLKVNMGVQYPLRKSLGISGLELDLEYLNAHFSTGVSGLQLKLDPVGLLKTDVGGLDVKIAPAGSMQNLANLGLALKIDPTSGALRSEVGGLDVVVDNITIKKTPFTGITGNYVGEAPDITVTGNTIFCNISGGVGITKTGSVMSVNMVGEAPDITVTGNVIACHITSGAGLVKVANVISLSPDTISRLGKLEADSLSQQGQITTIKGDVLSLGTRVFNLEQSNVARDSRILKTENDILLHTSEITTLKSENLTQNTRLFEIETTRLPAIETMNTTQNTRLTSIEGINTTQNTRLTSIEGINTTQNTRLTSVETINTTQNTRLGVLETTTYLLPLRKVANVVSIHTDLLDKVDDIGDRLDDVAEIADTAKNIGQNALDKISNLDLPDYPNVPNVPKENFFSQIGKGIGNLASGIASIFGGIAGGMGAATIAGGVVSAQTAGASMLANAGIATALGMGMGILGGVISGGIAGAIGDSKSGTAVGNLGISSGDLAGNKYGFSICSPYDYNATLYSSRTTAICGIVPLLGTSLPQTDSTSNITGLLVVAGGIGCLGDIYSKNGKVANESWVTGLNYATTSILNNHVSTLTSSIALKANITDLSTTQTNLTNAINLKASIADLNSSVSTLTALANSKENPITFDGNFIRNVNNLSLNPSVSIDTLNVGQNNLKVEKIPLVVPVLTANVDQGYTISASSTYMSYSPWRAFGDSSSTAITDAFLTAARYGSSGLPSTLPSTTTVDGIDYIGEWLQIQVPTPCTVTSFTLQAFNSYMTRHPIQFVFCAENADGTWTALFNQSTNLTAWTAFQVREFAFPNTKVSTKYRLVVTRVGTNPTTGYMQILQMSLSAFTRSVSIIAPSATYNGSPIINQSSLDSQLSLKADVTSIPSLAGYATESFVLGKNYITSAALTPYALTSQLPSLVGYATESWVNAKNYITIAALTPYALTSQIPSLTGYATESWVNAKNYITIAALTPYALTSQIPSLTGYALTSQIPSLTGYATESWVNAKNYITSASLPDLTPYALKTYVTGLGYITSSALPDLNPYALKTFVTSQGYITASSIPDVSGFATTVYVDAGLATKVNQTLFDSTLSNYSTTSQMQTYVTGLNYLTSSSLANYQQTIVAGTGLTKSTNTLSVNSAQTQITSVGTLTGLSVSGTSVPSIANTSSTASVNMLTLYQANQPAGYNALRMGRASSSYNHLVISYNYSSAGSTSNWCEFGLGSAPHIKIDGLGVTTVDSLIVSNTTNSTSTTNGAVQILGGLGVMKSIWCSSLYGFSADVAELSAGSITISGNSLSTTLTNLQSQIDTKANSSQIVDAYTKTESNTTFPKFYDLDMRLSSERGWTTGNFVQQTHTGVVTLTNNTASTSSTTGALKITGGVGIGGSLYVANNIYMGNNILVTQNGMNSALSAKQNILTSTTACSIGDLLVNGTSVDFPNLTGGNTFKFGSFQIFSNHSSGYSYIQSGLSSRAGWQDVIFSSYGSTSPNITIRTAGNMGLGNFPANQTEAITYSNVTSTNPTLIVNGGVDCKQLFVSGTMPFLPYQNAGWMWNYNGGWYNADNGYGSMQNGVSIFAKGRIGGIGFIAVSDRRTKDNIETLPACTETLMKVRPVQYTSKIDGSFNIGIIADEIQDLFPCVSTDQSSGLKHMEYQQLYMVAIKALQETINEVKKLKQKLKALSRNGRNQKRHSQTSGRCI